MSESLYPWHARPPEPCEPCPNCRPAAPVPDATAIRNAALEEAALLADMEAEECGSHKPDRRWTAMGIAMDIRALKTGGAT